MLKESKMEDGTYRMNLDRTLTPIIKTNGYWVAVAETTLEEAGWGWTIGVWTDPETNKVWVDYSVWVDNLLTAMMLGRANKQLAIWDVAKAEAITL